MLPEMRFLCKTIMIMICLMLVPSFFTTAQAQGIDVSKYQGTIDWTTLAKSKKVKFVYIRATEGTSIKDPKYKANLDSARNAKILVGSYHVYSSKTSASTQFANFKSVVLKKKQDLIPVLDIEGYYSGRLNMAHVDKILQLMEKEYGAKPMIYTSEMVFKEHFSGKKYSAYHFFIAKYKGTPNVRYTLWQYSRSGRVPGISGAVDLDKFHPKHSLKDLYLPTPKQKVADTANADSAAVKSDTTGTVISGAKADSSKTENSATPARPAPPMKSSSPKLYRKPADRVKG